MDNVRLRPMTKEEFEIYFAQFREQILKDAMRAFHGIAEDVAQRTVDNDLRDVTRDGFESKNNYWFTLLNDDAKSIGSLWFSIKGEGEKQTPYLSDLFIAPNFRGQGIGKRALLLLDAELKSRGIKNNIAVHIIGDFNESAIRLFKSSGYIVSAILMEKTISS